MRQIACVGDPHLCAIHGPNVIIEGGSAVQDGRPVARLGDKCACGCVIVEGWPAVTCDGRPVAFTGARTTGGAIGPGLGRAVLA